MSLTKKSATYLKKRAGVTLIEILISIIIFALVAAVGGAAVQLARSSIVKQRDRNAALTEAIRIMELIRTSSVLWSSPANNFYPQDPSDPYDGHFSTNMVNWTVNINNRTNLVTGTIQHGTNSPYNNINMPYNEITVTIYLPDEQDVVLSTIVTDTDTH